MTAIILTGKVAVEQNIIGLTDSLAPVRVFPNPLGKSLFNEFLLALGDGRFLLLDQSDPYTNVGDVNLFPLSHECFLGNDYLRIIVLARA